MVVCSKGIKTGVIIILVIGLLYLAWMIWLASNCGRDQANNVVQPVPQKKEELPKSRYYATVNKFHRVPADGIDVTEFENKSNGVIVLNCADGTKIITHISNVIIYKRSDK